MTDTPGLLVSKSFTLTILTETSLCNLMCGNSVSSESINIGPKYLVLIATVISWPFCDNKRNRIFVHDPSFLVHVLLTVTQFSASCPTGHIVKKKIVVPPYYRAAVWGGGGGGAGGGRGGGGGGGGGGGQARVEGWW
jgi:uncharacterized membrane protein YgcG